MLLHQLVCLYLKCNGCIIVQVTSCVRPDYMSHQFDINEKMRSILVDWLIEVAMTFQPYVNLQG